jgi:hypothetical protein
MHIRRHDIAAPKTRRDPECTPIPESPPHDGAHGFLPRSMQHTVAHGAII